MTLRDTPYHVTIEVTNENCRGLKVIKDLGIEKCELIDIRDLQGTQTRHLIRFPSAQIRRMPEGVFSQIQTQKSSGETTVWFDSEGCQFCKTIMSYGSFLVSGRHVEGSLIAYEFVVSDFQAFKDIIASLESNGMKPKIMELAKFEPEGKILTEKQERVLWYALKSGYFEYPRKIDTGHLSKKLGIAPSTLSESLRRGIRRMLEKHFER